MDTGSYILPPDPQICRSRWIDLRGIWGFAHDDSNHGLSRRWQERASSA